MFSPLLPSRKIAVFSLFSTLEGHTLQKRFPTAHPALAKVAGSACPPNGARSLAHGKRRARAHDVSTRSDRPRRNAVRDAPASSPRHTSHQCTPPEIDTRNLATRSQIRDLLP